MTEQEHQQITVDIARSPRECKEFTAAFAPVAKPSRVEIVIQANRIFAASYLFRFPFRMDVDETLLNPAAAG
jgi:hypothetical protein